MCLRTLDSNIPALNSSLFPSLPTFFLFSSHNTIDSITNANTTSDTNTTTTTTRP
jgi:hypothetical protein